MKYYRGDTLVITASYDDYTFQPGDTVTAGILQLEDEEYKVMAEVTVNVQEEGDAIQLEFKPEQTHDIDGECVIEVRTITSGGVEMTIQKNIELRKDGLR